MGNSIDKSGKPWDDNLPKNKEYIKKFYKKSEKEIVEENRLEKSR